MVQQIIFYTAVIFVYYSMLLPVMCVNGFGLENRRIFDGKFRLLTYCMYTQFLFFQNYNNQTVYFKLYIFSVLVFIDFLKL
jgi:hypothetical protein